MKMTLDTLTDIAEEIIQGTHELNPVGATVITLEGDLGAGKTTLTQTLARVLGVKESITSPTFVIIKKYGVVDKKFKHMVHIDAYRLEKSSELWNLGFQKLLDDHDNLIIIEWPQHVPECIPKDSFSIKLSHVDDDTRSIEF